MHYNTHHVRWTLEDFSWPCVHANYFRRQCNRHRKRPTLYTPYMYTVACLLYIPHIYCGVLTLYTPYILWRAYFIYPVYSVACLLYIPRIYCGVFTLYTPYILWHAYFIYPVYTVARFPKCSIFWRQVALWFIWIEIKLFLSSPRITAFLDDLRNHLIFSIEYKSLLLAYPVSNMGAFQ